MRGSDTFTNYSSSVHRSIRKSAQAGSSSRSIKSPAQFLLRRQLLQREVVVAGMRVPRIPAHRRRIEAEAQQRPPAFHYPDGRSTPTRYFLPMKPIL